MSDATNALENGNRAANAGDWPRAVTCWIEADGANNREARRRLRWLLHQVDGNLPRRPDPLPRLPLLVTGVAVVVAAGMLATGYRSASWWLAVPIWIAIAIAAGAAIWFAWRAGAHGSVPLTDDELTRVRAIASNSTISVTRHGHHPA